MTQQTRTGLKELQRLDTRIHDARQRIHDFDPRFEEVEEPALILESELETSRNRLKEMKAEERRLERSVQEKRERVKKLDERLGGVRNLREEAAVSAELEMVKRALQSDEQEAMTLIDQVRKGEERVSELEAAFDEASELVEPQRKELLAEREEARKDLELLEKERESFAAGIDEEELRIYEAIRGKGQRAAVAELTEDGACGNCFGMVPLQHQNEIRHGDSLIRCEACGVILAAPSAESEEPPAEELTVAEEAPAEDGPATAAEDESSSAEAGDGGASEEEGATVPAGADGGDDEEE
jgi:predicted  nucleic acid-binding Zn-ribbon protein